MTNRVRTHLYNQKRITVWGSMSAQNPTARPPDLHHWVGFCCCFWECFFLIEGIFPTYLRRRAIFDYCFIYLHIARVTDNQLRSDGFQGQFIFFSFLSSFLHIRRAMISRSVILLINFRTWKHSTLSILCVSKYNYHFLYICNATIWRLYPAEWKHRSSD